METQGCRQEEMGPFGRVLPPSLQGLGYKTEGELACFFVEGRQLGGLPLASVEGCFRFVVGATVTARDGGVEIKIPLVKVDEAGRGMSRVLAEVGSLGEQFPTGGSGRWMRSGRVEDCAEGGESGLGFAGIRRQFGFVLDGGRGDGNGHDGHGC